MDSVTLPQNLILCTTFSHDIHTLRCNESCSGQWV